LTDPNSASQPPSQPASPSSSPPPAPVSNTSGFVPQSVATIPRGSSGLQWVGGLAVLCAVGGLAYWLGGGGNGGSGGTETGRPKVGRGLTAEQSRLTAVFMAGQWIESDTVFDDTQTWTGSGVIIDEQAGDLIIMTNSHCVALPSIVEGQPETPDIASYEFAVVLASGDQPYPVKQFAETRAAGLDLALLRIPRGALRRGVDYEVAPIAKRSKASQGLETVAIGAPRGLRNTETFGRVSALRNAVETGGYDILQTDAAVNPGNSGGPLFVVQDGERFLVAINTFKMSGAENLNFAYFADEYDARSWDWYDANPAGVVKALREVYNFEAVESR
jgi:S1-C subfamily serine protease